MSSQYESDSQYEYTDTVEEEEGSEEQSGESENLMSLHDELLDVKDTIHRANELFEKVSYEMDNKQNSNKIIALLKEKIVQKENVILALKKKLEGFMTNPDHIKQTQDLNMTLLGYVQTLKEENKRLQEENQRLRDTPAPHTQETEDGRIAELEEELTTQTTHRDALQKQFEGALTTIDALKQQNALLQAQLAEPSGRGDPDPELERAQQRAAAVQRAIGGGYQLLDSSSDGEEEDLAEKVAILEKMNANMREKLEAANAALARAGQTDFRAIAEAKTAAVEQALEENERLAAEVERLKQSEHDLSVEVGELRRRPDRTGELLRQYVERANAAERKLRESGLM